MKSVHFGLPVLLSILSMGTASTALANTESSTQSLIFDSVGIGQIGKSFAAGVTAFDDLFTFVVPAGFQGDLGASIVSGISFSPLPSFSTQLTGFALYLGYPDKPASVVSSATWLSPGVVAYTGGTNLVSGEYYLEVLGTVNNATAGGAFAGTVSLNLSPVPEPSSLALLLAGLGLAGCARIPRKR